MAKALAYTEIADFLQAKMKSHPQLDELSADDDYQPRESFSDLDEPTFPRWCLRFLKTGITLTDAAPECASSRSFGFDQDRSSLLFPDLHQASYSGRAKEARSHPQRN